MCFIIHIRLIPRVHRSGQENRSGPGQNKSNYKAPTSQKHSVTQRALKPPSVYQHVLIKFFQAVHPFSKLKVKKEPSLNVINNAKRLPKVPNSSLPSLFLRKGKPRLLYIGAFDQSLISLLAQENNEDKENAYITLAKFSSVQKKRIVPLKRCAWH